MDKNTVFNPEPGSLAERFPNEPSVVRYPESALRRIEAVGWDVVQGGCHNWRGQTRGKRAKFNLPEGNRNAVRVLWLLVRGPIPEGMELAHQCHNAICVNLDHMEIQTPPENHAAERGKTRPHSRRRQPSVSPDIDSLLRRLYDSGLSIRQVSETQSLTEDVVRGSLRRTGTNRRAGRPAKVVASHA